ncbi:MAG TPA: SMR family transporter [Stellaceae bacterium]|nr:SMR family transporter [Stellaceae bacterium]
MTGWVMLAVSIVFNVAGNLFVKQFSATTEIRNVWDYVSVPFVLGIAAFGIGVIFYGRALKDIPIVLAYPIQVGACIVVIALFAVAVFGERIGLRDALGFLLIVGGIALLSRMA